MQGEIVTPAEAEEVLVEAMELLMAMPDRERGHLAHGRGLRMTGWPDIVREVGRGDYVGGQEPRRRIGVKEVALVERMLTGEGAAAMAVPERHRRLFGAVLVMKARPGPGGICWERVFEQLGKAACGPSINSARMRYERAVAAVAQRINGHVALREVAVGAHEAARMGEFAPMGAGEGQR